LSHFVVDEELDQLVLTGLQERDRDTLTSLPEKQLQSGNSEAKNWIALGGAAEHLDMQVIDYIPCYRTPAGTGCAMGFARWT
jgi:3-O-methylgallate 3,4-dioxygenase